MRLSKAPLLGAAAAAWLWPSVAHGAPAAVPPAAGCARDAFRAVLDVGHDPESPGAISARGVPEFRFNLALARRILQQLHRNGFTRARLLVRERRGLAARARALNALDPALVISVHHDSVQPRYLRRGRIGGRLRTFSDRHSGYSIFVSHKNPRREESERFARILGEELIGRDHRFTMHHAEDIPGENRPVIDGRVGVFRYDGLVVLREVRAPAVLFEAAVIVNPQDEQRAGDGAFRSDIAAAVAAAVERHCAGEPGAPAAEPAPGKAIRPAAAPSPPPASR